MLIQTAKIKTLIRFIAVFILIFGYFCLSSTSAVLAQNMSTSLAPLPSWNEGKTKSTILDFVERVTTEDSPDFIPIEDRIATFDNDGTLWAEQPLIQGMFVLSKLKAEIAKDPSLKDQPIFQALLAGNVEYLTTASAAELTELLAAINSGVTEEKFEQDVQEFFKTQTHPTLNVPYTELAYQPMVELLEYLRSNNFQTWICSGGGIDFIRQISQSLYGIPPQQVIGSSIQKEFVQDEGKPILKRMAKLGSYNDKTAKPVNIDLHIGKPPVFAAGNVRSGGDVAMLTYSQTYPGSSFQLIINHDDGDREFAYSEPDNTSLKAAEEQSWVVVSMKEDWKTIFATSPTPPSRAEVCKIVNAMPGAENTDELLSLLKTNRSEIINNLNAMKRNMQQYDAEGYGWQNVIDGSSSLEPRPESWLIGALRMACE